MNYRREDIEMLERDQNKKISLREAAEKTQRDILYEQYQEREAIKEAATKKFNNFQNFREDVKKKLLTEAISNICAEALDSYEKSDRAMMESFVSNYVNEAGSYKLLSKMKYSNSSILRTIAEAVNSHSKAIIEEADPDNPDSLIISPENVDSFWAEVDNAEDIDDITNTIRLRVANAEEEFITRNQQDKDTINSILQDTANRIEQNKPLAADDAQEQRFEESVTRMAKQQIYKVQHESYHNIFDKMVRNLSESVIKCQDDELKSIYMTESNRLNVPNIVDTVRCMYTLLETVSTLGIEEVTPEYLKETIESIKL